MGGTVEIKKYLCKSLRYQWAVETLLILNCDVQRIVDATFVWLELLSLSVANRCNALFRRDDSLGCLAPPQWIQKIQRDHIQLPMSSETNKSRVTPLSTVGKFRIFYTTFGLKYFDIVEWPRAWNLNECSTFRFIQLARVIGVGVVGLHYEIGSDSCDLKLILFFNWYWKSHNALCNHSNRFYVILDRRKLWVVTAATANCNRPTIDFRLT